MRKMRLLLTLGLFCLSPACGSPFLPPFRSLVLDQPYVLELSPPDGSHVQNSAEWTVRFSERIDVANLQPNSVALLSGIKDPKVFSNTQDLEEKLQAGELTQVPLQYLLDSDEQTLTLLPEAELTTGIYYLVITPALHSVRGLPFNQIPGENPTLFLARFACGDIPSGDLGTLPETTDPSGSVGFGPPPQSLVLNEFRYDGKVSETDGEAFVELFGTPNTDISLYQVFFINGEDGAETEHITLPPGSILPEDGIFVIADLRTGSHTESKVPNADYFDQFDPQNGPDGIQLFDRDGHLLDSVVYGTGAAAETGLPVGEGDPAPDVAAGHSLSRHEGQDTQNNQVDLVDLTTPTPGIL